MARTARVVLNRRAANEIDLGLADGLFDLGVAIHQRAKQEVPDAPPAGRGLIEGGGVIAYVGTKKTAGTTIGGRAIAKPRAFRTRSGIVSILVGFGFPGRLVHNGSIHNTPNPFLARSAFAELPGAEDHVVPALTSRVGGRS